MITFSDDMVVEDFEDLVTINKADQPTANIIFIDFETQTSVHNMSTIGPSVFSKSVDINHPIKYNDMKTDFLNVVRGITLTKQEIRERKLNRILNEKVEKIEKEYTDRQLTAKILCGGNKIAAEGRIGPATHLIISEENYVKYKSAFTDYLNQHFKIIHADISDIILYRKSTMDQPGLALIHTDVYYKFILKGFYPEKQFYKIKL